MGLRGRQKLQGEKQFFVTTTVVQHARVFTVDRYCDILVNNIKHYQDRYKFIILAYVVMPTHFHWVVQVDPDRGTVSDVMRDIKKYSAWDLMEALEQDNRENLLRLFTRAAFGFKRHQRKFWTDRFDDQFIRNEGMLRTKVEYIHNNPVKAGLVKKAEGYKYSSARNYIFGDQSVLEIKTDWWSN